MDPRPTPSAAPANAIGIVKTVVGTVKAVDPSGGERILQAGDQVFANETIVTSDGGLVLIEFFNGGRLDLPSNSQIALDVATVEAAGAAAAPKEQLTTEQIQELIARGEDPAAVAEAAAAGAAANDEGGVSFVVVHFNNAQGSVTSGFTTAGIPAPTFPPLQPELPPVIDDEDVDGGVPGPGPEPEPEPDTLPGIVTSGPVVVDEGNLPDGTRPDPAALTQTASFTISAADGVQSLSIAGQTVISNGVFTPVTITTQLGNTLAITGFDAATGTVTYSYTLNGKATHAAGAGNNVLSENFTVSLTDEDGDSATGTLVVNIADDAPVIVDDVKTVPEATLADLNIGFILDFSTSIDNNELDIMVDAVKAVAQDIFAMNPEGTSISLVVFSATSLTFGPFTSYEEFHDLLNALNPPDGGVRPLPPGTDFTDAIETAMDFYVPVLGANNQLFFVSDGNPNQQLGPGGNSLTEPVSIAWRSFLEEGGINVATIGVGDNIKLDRLQDIDLDGEGEPVLIDHFHDLLEALAPVVQPGITGNVIARDDINSGADNDAYGADGGRLLSIQVDTLGGLVTYTWDGGNTITLSGAQSGTITGTSFSVETGIGGKFTFHFATAGANSAGKWVYDPPQNVDAAIDDTFVYQVIDGDGDIASGTLTVTVTDNGTLSAENSALTLAMPGGNEAMLPDSWLTAIQLRGNVLASHQAGSVVTFANMLAVTAAGIDIAGLYGILHVEPSGEYVYTPYTPDMSPDAVDTFSYTIQHSDGSTTSATLSLDLTDAETQESGGHPIQGTAAGDILTGLDGDDLMFADTGDDTVSGGNGFDRLSGGAGADFLSGNDGADLLEGGSGDDSLQGGAEADILTGGEGADILDGGADNDVLVGGLGNDILVGGEGRDVFLWKAGEIGQDTIRDFAPGIGGDVLNLADMLQDEHADALGSYLSFSFDGHNTTLVIDTDGTGPASATQTIVLEGVDLTANNTLTNAAIIHNLLADGNLKVDP